MMNCHMDSCNHEKLDSYNPNNGFSQRKKGFEIMEKFALTGSNGFYAANLGMKATTY